MSTYPYKYYSFDDYRLSISDNEIKLYTGRHQVPLSPEEVRVFRILFENHKKLVEKETLGKELGTKDETVLRKVILRLRKTLSDPLEEGRIIRTERRKGYIFVAEVWPMSYEDFIAGIKPGTQSSVDNASSQPEPVIDSYQTELDKTSIPLEPAVPIPVEEEKEEEVQTQSDAEGTLASADEENVRKNISTETDASLAQPTEEGEAQAAHGDDESAHTPLPANEPSITDEPSLVTDSNDGSNTFGKWMFGSGWLLTVIALLCLLVVFAFSVYGYVYKWEGLNALVSGAQLMLLFASLFYPIRGAHSFKRAGPALTEDIKNSTGYDDPDEWVKASGIAEKVWEQYKKYWRWLLFTWFLLYLSITLTSLPGLGLNCPIDGSRFCIGGMNNAGKLAEILQDQNNPVAEYLRGKLPEPMQQKLNGYREPQPLPVELERAIVEVFNQTLRERDKEFFEAVPENLKQLNLPQEIKDKQQKHLLSDEELARMNLTLLRAAFPGSEQNKLNRGLSIIVRMVTTLFNNATSLLIFLCFNILNKPTKIKFETGEVKDNYLVPGAAIVLLLAFAQGLLIFYAASSQDTYEVLKVGSYVSGFLGGLAMALYFGRLHSAYLGTPRWFVILLFIYTLIQTLFILLEEREEVAVPLIDFALLMKCLLFLYMIWLFKSGRLLFYLVRVRRTDEKVPDEFPIFRRVLNESS